jgi:dCMP deaminase
MPWNQYLDRIRLYSRNVKLTDSGASLQPLLGVPAPNPKTFSDQPKRPSWDEYYLNIALAVSLRGDCVRAQHGAVVVKDHKIVSTGYNGTPSGDPRSCGATGQCPRALDPNSQHAIGNYDLCWATHAESNALLRASWDDLRGATLYITGQPCSGCSKLIASAGIERVVYHGQE